MQRQTADNNNGGFDVIALIISALIMSAIVMMCHSCKQIEYVPVIENHTDTMYISKVQRDSIYLHDSTYIKEKGDTLLIEKWHTKYIEKQLHDTTYVATHDTIPQPYEVVKEVKYTPKLVKLLAWLGGIGILAGIVLLIFRIRKFLHI